MNVKTAKNVEYVGLPKDFNPSFDSVLLKCPSCKNRSINPSNNDEIFHCEPCNHYFKLELCSEKQSTDR